ncbi:MAG: nitroreductase family deazaflavin-dependent oxidoreductase [Gammaproteobacteria bacterium]|nr:nitroreductase family deazaflavin-dependent oxidoreductase [Gammaproteobacteria bacterium]
MDLEEMNRKVIEEFRANAGKVGGQFDGAPMLLLTTVGAKTGATRVNPLVYLMDGARYVIIASFAGAPHNPPWFHNLVKNPKVRVEVGSEQFGVRAEVLTEPARTEFYQKMAGRMPVFNDYAKKTTRTIPVIALHRL